MELSHEVEAMKCVAKGADHLSAPIPQEGRWTRAKEVKDIFGLTHGVGWCAPQQGACKLTINVKAGVIEEALVETIGCTLVYDAEWYCCRFWLARCTRVRQLLMGLDSNQLSTTFTNDVNVDNVHQ